MATEPEHAIDVETLTKRYGDLLAVDDISFHVRTGEVFAFLGPNGAGKTTTVEIIETISPPTSGKVRLLGMDVTTRKRDIVPRIGVLPQGFSSFDISGHAISGVEYPAAGFRVQIPIVADDRHSAVARLPSGAADRPRAAALRGNERVDLDASHDALPTVVQGVMVHFPGINMASPSLTGYSLLSQIRVPRPLII